jgi:uncharacterized membrane protein
MIMLQMLVTGLLWFSAIGCGLLAGLYFAFSAFIMTALGRIGQAAGIAAMNAINIAIVQSLFLPIFLATTAASAALAVTALLRWGEPGAMAMVAGGALYVLGMFVVTMIFNVPLNDALAAADPASHEAASLWARYLTDWTLWNHVRTVSSTAACALFHCGDRGEVGAHLLSVRDNCLAPVLRKSLQWWLSDCHAVRSRLGQSSEMRSHEDRA